MADVLMSSEATSDTGIAYDEPEARMLECIGVRDEAPGVKTFRLRDPHPDGARRFAPGQAMLLTLFIEGVRFDRTFSIASTPLEPDGLELTIKAQSDGVVTRWLHETFAPGMRIDARYPLGRFTLDASDEAPHALVSAGSGASPLMSMLRTLARRAPEADIAWLHCARGVQDILFADELAALQARMPNLKVSVWLSAPTPGWFGLRGRISRGALWVMVPDFGRRIVYCCGPAGFMQGVRQIHAAEGARRAAFHIEHFGPVIETMEREAAAAGAPRTGEQRDAVLHATLAGRRFDVRTGETLLVAAARQQIVIPCGCASGLCGTCKVRHVSGEVAMQHAGGLSPAEEAQGWILACSSRPLTHVEIAF
ncbi:hybrid-cluster NAD(P)-dependent oxidoreductase [Paraburkholderia sprentiae WSM5005]|uniref:Hybrid-cluster NAD(P)-dependent oxidoreductase n=1 Tax=Paraburkholderia sprentiae WSM5005 TaxID=754502 RepID=A0A1I9YSX2_9BURK|nr:hybrid-cluster NAD(P)-dependent oxidoreductase [Paraburkholderia sprentiae]APA89303.2 hybrid-cluster NAD(P)-dependent oxidoreductase [Paraburkholderia sprentiae WSM5005]